MSQMLSANEKINIAGYSLLGISLLPAIPVFSQGIIANFLITFLLSTIGASLFMNKGSKWILNILAQKEPVLLGLGTATFMTNYTVYRMIPNEGGLTMASVALGAILGTGLITVSLISRYTEILE